MPPAITKDDTDKTSNLRKAAPDAERLRSELARVQKMHTDLNALYEKQKKTLAQSDTMAQEHKKAQATTQAELKDLRMKLRTSEHERSQLSAKQGEMAEAKKSLQSLEAKRREDMRERDKRIAELEKSLVLEKKRSGTMEARVTELKGKDDDRKALQTDTKQAKVALDSLRAASGAREEELVARVQQLQSMLSAVAEEYGLLVANTVSLSAHTKAKHETHALRCRNWRLERKLANSEGQVIELAHLIRAVKEQNALLSQELADSNQQLLSLDFPRSDEADRSLFDAVAEEEEERVRSLQQELHNSNTSAIVASQVAATYNNWCRDLAAITYSLDETHQTTLLKSVEQGKEVSRLTTLCQEERSQVARSEERRKEIQQALDKECLSKQRLVVLAQTSKMAETKLRVEVTQLVDELVIAEKYREAYGTLYAEAEALVSRNELAETEAEKLSKLNAEIIGHANPSQRIMYLESIRQELADTKQNLLVSQRSHKAASVANAELKKELGVYKSVSGPSKTSTSFTRVSRSPLADLNRQNSLDSQSITPSSSTVLMSTPEHANLLDGMSPMPEMSGAWSVAEEDMEGGYLHEDMTIDEIM
ncbi:hypothetical protein BDV98DRAFT_603640 [Pterulicium gracile]|uniref:Uncharacterized protein n=1 Tax=Pterulicium gracile TaxID=1884261 RepID=A0A5C3QLN1_9AGAR|nr:hypothetical protein BDV98DRAFT_603640 [Pterula gracilis]